MYANVLLPTDGSEGATEAIDVGLEVSKRFDATAHALFVIDERFVVDDYDIPVERAEREGERALEAVSRRGTEVGVDVENHLRRGVPHEEILRAIEDYGVDLVVMGTHGRTGLDRLVRLGSVAERVVRHAPVHVLTIPIRPARQDR